MPRSPGDPDAILAALSPLQREAFVEALDLFDFDGPWQGAPIIGWIKMVAWLQLSLQIREEEGCSRESAQIAAALRLGLSDSALTRRHRRNRAAVLEAADKTSSILLPRAG